MAKDYAKVYRGENVMKRGIATYKDEAIFLSQDTLHRDMETLKGRPVVIKHQDVTPENMEEKAVGYVTDTFYNNEAGTFGCKFVIFDDEAKELIRNGYSLSTCYKPTSFSAGGTEINTPYDREVTGLNFTHLALVPDPRYEDAKIYENGIMEIEEETLLNGGEGSGDFDHAGRPGEVGGSEPAGTGRESKYTKSGGQNWVGAKPKQGKLFDEEDKIDTKEYLKKGDLELGKTYKLGKIYVRPFEDEDGNLSFYDKTGVWGEGSLPQKFLISDLKNIERVKKYDNLTEKELKLLSEIEINKDDTKKEDKKDFEEYLEEALNDKKYKEKKYDLGKKEKFSIIDLLKKGFKPIETDIGYKLYDENNNNLINYYRMQKISKNEYNEITKLINEINAKKAYKQNAIIEEQERKNTMENEKMEIPVSFFDKVMDLICNSKKEKKNEEKEIEDVIDEEKEEEMENKCKKNEVVDKRDIIRQIMAIAGKKEASEEVKTIAKLAEKLAYDKDEAEKENAKEKVDEDYNNDEFFNALEIAKSLGEADKLPVPETQAKQIERGKEIFG